MSELDRIKEWAESPVGVWKVTTEGDCEGRSTKNLGTFFGHVADIAAKLHSQSFYSLKFAKVDPAEVDLSAEMPEEFECSIVLDINSGTWDMKHPVRDRVVSEWLNTEPSAYNISPDKCNYYASSGISGKKKSGAKTSKPVSKLPKIPSRILQL